MSGCAAAPKSKEMSRKRHEFGESKESHLCVGRLRMRRGSFGDTLQKNVLLVTNFSD